MPKGKLKVLNVDVPKLVLASELADVKINEEESKEIGDTSIIEISFKTANQLFELGRYVDKIKPPKKGE